MPFFALSPLAQDFVTASYRGHWVWPEIIWSDWAGSAHYRRLRADADAMSSASADEIAHLLTTLIRGDRFNEGLLAAAFEEGLLHRILARVGELARDGGGASMAATRNG